MVITWRLSLGVEFSLKVSAEKLPGWRPCLKLRDAPRSFRLSTYCRWCPPWER